jgi:ABC-type transporter Mla subunit MlaD
MNTKTHHFRIGLFVVTGGLLLVGALFALGLRAFFGKQDIFETSVTGKVENLSVGALVRLRGVTIGKVTSIDFVGAEYPQYKERYVIIQFEVPRGTAWGSEPEYIRQTLNAEIEQGLRARVQTQGFIGAGFLSLENVDPKEYPTEPIPWTPKHFYIPSAPSQFNHLLSSLEKSLGHVENLDLAGLIDRVKTLVDAGNRLVNHIDQIDFKHLGTNVDSLLVDLHENSGDIRKTLADAQTAIKGADLPRLSQDTRALEAKLSSAAQELRRLLAGVNTGELNSSLANVRVATDELIVLIHDLEQRPSSLLFSKPPGPLPEVEEPPKK